MTTHKMIISQNLQNRQNHYFQQGLKIFLYLFGSFFFLFFSLYTLNQWKPTLVTDAVYDKAATHVFCLINTHVSSSEICKEFIEDACEHRVWYRWFSQDCTCGRRCCSCCTYSQKGNLVWVSPIFQAIILLQLNFHFLRIKSKLRSRVFKFHTPAIFSSRTHFLLNYKVHFLYKQLVSTILFLALCDSLSYLKGDFNILISW